VHIGSVLFDLDAFSQGAHLISEIFHPLLVLGWRILGADRNAGRKRSNGNNRKLV
jgi:hypothetical protein